MTSSPPPSTVAQAVRSPASRALDIPSYPTRFVGRDHELAELTALLGTTRLLTLTGAGGSGKTRLAREAAITVNGFARVAWVDLVSIADGALVPQQAATALHAPDHAGMS